MKKTLSLLAVLLLSLPAPAQEPAKPGKAKEERTDARTRFWEARRVMLRGDPATAAELFRTIEKEDPDAEVADDCLYWTGRCCLRLEDREPDAVVAFLALIERHPLSPFTDDAARELHRLGDRKAVKILLPRLEKDGAGAEIAARALAELGEEAGVAWLAAKEGKKKELPKAVPEPAGGGKDKGGGGEEAGGADPEVAKLREEIRRLRKELDEAIALVTKLLEEREKKVPEKPGKGEER